MIGRFSEFILDVIKLEYVKFVVGFLVGSRCCEDIFLKMNSF